MRTTFKSAASIRRRSSSHRDSGHCSGYHASPTIIAFCPGICVGMGLPAGVWAKAAAEQMTAAIEIARTKEKEDVDMHGSNLCGPPLKGHQVEMFDSVAEAAPLQSATA